MKCPWTLYTQDLYGCPTSIHHLDFFYFDSELTVGPNDKAFSCTNLLLRHLLSHSLAPKMTTLACFQSTWMDWIRLRLVYDWTSLGSPVSVVPWSPPRCFLDRVA